MSRAQLTSTVEQNTGGAVAPFVAGKNKIINGDFGIWQRGTSFSNFNAQFTADRWKVEVGGGIPTGTITQQTFTPGAAPVAGYEGSYYMQINYTALNSATVIELSQKIEDVRTFAGQTITLSFWAKADTTRTLTSAFFRQNFGTGGSASVDTGGNSPVLTTSWQRFSYIYTIPSISGKTIGTGSSLDVRFDLPVTAGSTISIWGIQVEAGSVATAFQTATGTLQGELTACQRYYFRQSGANGVYARFTTYVPADNTTTVYCILITPVSMRIVPTVLEYSNLSLYGGGFATFTSATISNDSTPTTMQIAVTGSGMTQYRPYALLSNNTSSGYLAVSAEL